jgi:alkaline phosphatase isozyme conversion protein
MEELLMIKRVSKQVFILFTALALIVSNLLAMNLYAQSPSRLGLKAMQHVEYLSKTIGTRVANSAKEIEAKDYIASEFQRIGYQTTVQPFTYVRSGATSHSNNVIAVKPGRSQKEVIVGAHYDSVNATQRSTNVIKDENGNILYPGMVATGACDNASGIGVMLEVAEMLKNVETNYTIRFIAFGAEEVGLRGSTYYASQMTPEQVNNTVAMINLDTLISGDFMYVYSGIDENVWVREQALALADKLGMNVQTNPGLNEEYPAGTAGDWSDHAPFRKKGIPVAYFEATNWEIGDLDGYWQTEKHGMIIHTWKDNLDFIMSEFPGRVEERLDTFTTLLYHLLVQITPPDNVASIELEGASAKETWNLNATIPFRFSTLGSGKPSRMDGVTVRLFARNGLVAEFKEGKGSDSIRSAGKAGEYIVNINTKALGLTPGKYILLVEYNDKEAAVRKPVFVNVKK